MKNGFLLTVDGGGTKTEAFCLSLDGNYFRKYLKNGSNYSVYGDNGLKVIGDIITEAAGEANINPSDFKGIVLGLAGYSADKPKKRLNALLRKLNCDSRTYLLADAHLGLYAIFRDKPGIVVISGTGSICMGKDNQGNIYRAGGYGWLVGDEGSGFWLGQNAMKRVLMLPISRQTVDVPLIKYILEILDVPSLEDAARKITLSSSPHSVIASLAQAVSRAAKDNDEIALQIIHEGGSQLAETILQLCERMNFQDKTLELGYMGSVIENLPSLRDAISATLEYHFDKIIWKTATTRPAVGGIFYLLEKLNITPSAQLLTKINNLS